MGFFKRLWNGIKGFLGIGSNSGQGGAFATDQLNSALNAQRNWEYYQKQAGLDHQYNLMTMEKQAEIARGQYDYEYAKESPAARVAQYEQAGLNSALMYSNGVAGMQGSVSSPTPATSRGSMHMPDSQLSQLMQAGQRARVTQSEINANDSLAEFNNAKAEHEREEASKTRVETLISKKNLALKDLEIAGKKIENAKSEQERKYFMDSYQRKLDQLDLINKQIEQETATSKSLEDKNIEETKTEGVKRSHYNADIALKNATREQTELMTKFERDYGVAFRDIELERIEQEIGTSYADELLKLANGDLTKLKYEYLPKEYQLKLWDTIAKHLLDAKQISKMKDHDKSMLGNLVLSLIFRKL